MSWKTNPPPCRCTTTPGSTIVRRVEPGRYAAGVDVLHGGDGLAVGRRRLRPGPLAVGRDVEAGFERLNGSRSRLDSGPGLWVQCHVPSSGTLAARAFEAQSRQRVRRVP